MGLAINVVDNDFLNHRGETPQEFGYAVFGKVVSGMDVVDKIKVVKTTSRAGHQDVPEETVTIKSVRLETARKKVENMPEKKEKSE